MTHQQMTPCVIATTATSFPPRSAPVSSCLVWPVQVGRKSWTIAWSSALVHSCPGKCFILSLTSSCTCAHTHTHTQTHCPTRAHTHSASTHDVPRKNDKVLFSGYLKFTSNLLTAFQSFYCFFWRKMDHLIKLVSHLCRWTQAGACTSSLYILQVFCKLDWPFFRYNSKLM